MELLGIKHGLLQSWSLSFLRISCEADSLEAVARHLLSYIENARFHNHESLIANVIEEKYSKTINVR